MTEIVNRLRVVVNAEFIMLFIVDWKIIGNNAEYSKCQ